MPRWVTRLCSTLAALGWLGAGTSCTLSKHLLKAKPSEQTSFLEKSKSLKVDVPDSGPFHYSARTMSSKALKKDSASRCIWIAPVDMSHLRPTSTALAATQERNGLYRPAPEMAAALRQEFRRVFMETPGARYRLVNKPVKGCVELHLALVEFNQTNAPGNVAKTLASTVVGPFAILAGPVVKGTIAIEGKVKIHGSGELLYQFADRESDPVTIVSLRSYSATGFALETIAKWARQFEQMTRMYSLSSRVRDANVIRLNPF